ncbi:MAG: iron-siderophore ABC transporter substrate-binding protein [Acidimicrobiia bacterium]
MTIEHRFGTTEVRALPERVVSLGYSDQDPVLALGTVPVLVREWFGNQPSATYPWAADRLGGAEPGVIDGEINLEQIAGARPDLIVATYGFIDDNQYRALSAIAPTLAQSGDYVDGGMPWQEVQRVIGLALGRADEADALVERTEVLIADARRQHPVFNGATGLVAYDFGPGQLGFYGPEDQRARLLASLGFELPPSIAGLVNDEFFGTVSDEQIGLLDADVLVWVEFRPDGAASVKENPVYQGQRVPREGRDVFLGDTIAGAAVSFATALSIPLALESLVPRLAAAIDGDPATEVPS